METNDRLINNTFFGIWAVNGLSMLFGIACVMIDAILTGQFLGKDAVTAAGLIQPVTMLVNLLGGLFGPGLGIVCTRYMGMAKKELVNCTFSMIMEILFVISIVTTLVLFLLSPSIANMLGANSGNEVIIQMTEDYLKGFSFAILPMCLSVSLSGLMILDNDKKRSILGVIVTLGSDFLFDYLNVTVFHGGMLGMAIATALSNYAGLLIVLTHFFKKDRVLSFSFILPDMRQVKEVMVCGIPNSVAMGSNAIRGICFNTFLLGLCGNATVAALSAANSLFSIIYAVALGMFATTSSLVSLLFGEEDRNGIVKALKISIKAVHGLLGALAVILFAFAEIFVRAFLDPSATTELAQSAEFVRFMALQLVFFAISFSLCGTYQGIRNNDLSNAFVVLREAIFPILCTFILGSALGRVGFCYGLVISGVLMLLTCFIIPSIIGKKPAFKAERLALLPDNLGAGKDDVFEASISSMEDVIIASEGALRFCTGKNLDRHTANMTALFIEETVANTLQHKGEKSKDVNVDLRVMIKGDTKVIRIRDNGRPFDPVEWYEKNHPEDPASGLGIRIIMKLAKDVKYIPAMRLNNLMITM